MRPHALLSATLLACAATASAADDIQIHGYISQGYLYSRGNNYLDETKEGSPGFTEVGFNVTASPADRVTLGLAMSAQDLGRYGNLQPGIDWAYGRYELPKKISWLDASVSVGRLKMGYGLYGDQVDLDMTRSAVFLPQVVYSPVYRDLFLAADGVQGQVSISAGSLGSFDISALTGHNNVTDKQVGLAELFVEPFQAGGSVTQVDKAEVKRAHMFNVVWNTPVDGLRFKSSLLHAEDVNTAGHGFARIGLGATGDFTWACNIKSYWASVTGAEFQHGDWTFAAEYFKQIAPVDVVMTSSVPSPALNFRSRTYYTVDAGYLTTAYRFNRSWEGVVTLSAANTSDENSATDDSGDWHRGISTAVRWDVTDHFLLKAEHQYNYGRNLPSSTDNPDGQEKVWHLFAVKATYDF